MNIALVLTQPFKPTEGGVQRSTSKLAVIFQDKGHKVIVISFARGENTLYQGIPVIYLGETVQKQDHAALKAILRKNDMKVIINQMGSSTRMTRILRRAAPKETKIINTLRINPLNFVQNSSLFLRNYLEERQIGFLYFQLWLLPLLVYHRIKQYLNHRYILQLVDAYVMLSKGFLDELSYFGISKEKYKDKLFAISNPFLMPDVPTKWEEKENIVLFVGRLNRTQKRVDLLMHIWQKLHPTLPEDWQFYVIGDGPERDWMEQFCKNNHMDRVHFSGYADPTPYYRKARVLHFTSAFEGFGNVLIEAQSHGVIPVLFNSYSAAAEIINPNKDGVLVEPFNIDEFVKATMVLVYSKEQSRNLSAAALQNAKRFGYDRIGQKWDNLLSMI